MADRDAKIREALITYVEGVGVRNVIKEDSLFMRILGGLLFFNKSFMTRFITTIGQTIYWPKSIWENDSDVCSVLPHEFTHAMDFRRVGLIQIALIYLFPQVLGILIPLCALGAIYNLAYLWFLLGLLFLLPIPAYGRKWFEMRGFAMTMATEIWLGSPSVKTKVVPPWIIRNFTESNYYWMWPFPGSVEKELQQWLTRINNGTIDEKIVMAKVIRGKIQGIH